jgi:hypothetical protein
MRRSPLGALARCRFSWRTQSRARANVRHVRNRVPFAVQLANLLRIHVEHYRNVVIMLGRFGLYRKQIQPAAGSRIHNAHQSPLRVAIADVKSLHSSRSHFLTPANNYDGSSSSIISDSAAPAGTMGKTFASGAQSNTSNSGPGERKKLSSRSPVSFDTGNSRMASSFRRQA